MRSWSGYLLLRYRLTRCPLLEQTSSASSAAAMTSGRLKFPGTASALPSPSMSVSRTGKGCFLPRTFWILLRTLREKPLIYLYRPIQNPSADFYNITERFRTLSAKASTSWKITARPRRGDRPSSRLAPPSQRTSCRSSQRWPKGVYLGVLLSRHWGSLTP